MTFCKYLDLEAECVDDDHENASGALHKANYEQSDDEGEATFSDQEALTDNDSELSNRSHIIQNQYRSLENKLLEKEHQQMMLQVNQIAMKNSKQTQYTKQELEDIESSDLDFICDDISPSSIR